MNLIRIIAFVVALITVVVTSDDILSEKLVKDYTAQLQRTEVVNAALTFGFRPLHTTLASLQQDYPGFTPVVTPWTEGGSAYLYYLGWGGGPGLYSITLPDQRVIIDRNGVPVKALWCASGEGQCEAIAPVNQELGISGTFFYAGSNDNGSGATTSTPAIDIAAYWKAEGQVETRANCIWAYTADISDQTLAVESVSNHAGAYEAIGLYGFYRVEVEFKTSTDNGDTTPFRYTTIERLTREQFFAQKDCLQGEDPVSD